jgi:hypothetical protein
MAYIAGVKILMIIKNISGKSLFLGWIKSQGIFLEINEEQQINDSYALDINLFDAVDEGMLSVISYNPWATVYNTGIKTNLENYAGEDRLDASAIKNLTEGFGPNQVTKTFFVDGNRIDSYTETGTLASPYKTIQAAITAAIATSVIVIAPGAYAENLILKAGIYLKSRSDVSSYGVTINGKLTYASGSGQVLLSGIYVCSTAGHALEFSGTDVMKIRAYNCKFETNSVGLHHAILATNTNSGSELRLSDVLVQVVDSSGGAKCIETNATSALSIGAKEATIGVVDDIDNVALNIDGSTKYWHTLDQIKGRVVVSAAASATISMCSMYSTAQAVLTTNSAGITTLSKCIILTNASPAVDGVGTFCYSGVAYTAGMGLATTLNGGAGPDLGAIATESAMNMIYDNTISGLAATKVKTAIDELKTLIAWTETGGVLRCEESPIQIGGATGPKIANDSGDCVLKDSIGNTLATAKTNKNMAIAGNVIFGASSPIHFNDNGNGYCTLKWGAVGEVTLWIHTITNYHEIQSNSYLPYSTNDLKIRLIDNAKFIVMQDAAIQEIASLNIDQFRQLNSNHGCGITRKINVSAETTLAGASTTIASVAPQNAKIIASGVIVSSLISSGDGGSTFAIDYNAGAASQAIATTQAFAKNTKTQVFFNANANSDIATAQVDHVITPDIGTFSGGKVYSFCIYESLVAFDDLA